MDLLDAIRSGNDRTATSLIRAGKSLEFADESGETPIFYAIRKDLPRLVDLMIEKGVNLDHESEDDLTPLLLAASLGNNAIVKKLLKKVDVNSLNREGETALHKAVETNSAPTVVLLLENEADPNIISRKEETPLSIAAAKGTRGRINLTAVSYTHLTLPTTPYV